jgi:glutathione S-transferase
VDGRNKSGHDEGETVVLRREPMRASKDAERRLHGHSILRGSPQRGSRFTLADMMLYAWLDFGAQVGQPLDEANSNLVAWFKRVAERPSVKA